MKNFLDTLAQAPLFRQIAAAELPALLHCLAGDALSFQSGQAICRAGDSLKRLGVVLSGRVQVVREHVDGNRTIITELKPGDLFGEAYACASGAVKTVPISVISVTASVVLLLDYQKVVTLCPQSCPFHSRLIHNMLAILADKNLLLNRRLGHLSKRSTREKILSYLYEQAALSGRAAFSIPFNRQELADYLCVERSALSAVLSKLQQEGVVRYRKNFFRLKELGKEGLEDLFI